MTYADYISKATPEERAEMQKRIEAIIGTQKAARESGRDLTERIQRSAEWRKQYEKLAKVFFENGEKALAMNFMQYGRTFKGVTASGKVWILEGNNGWTQRSRYCGSLFIEGEGTIFTSGRLDKVFDYILNN